ncbi:hypothetical protein FRB93_012850 [Tulasnella sp. JGI-2019a]|nr:hypothetical protein FRB93_012850 [Tulasnella sp. JGI-2019a]
MGQSTSLEDIKWLGSSDTFVARYDSPEVVMDEAPRTIASDVWSWGCLLIEIMKEVPPYSHLRSETAVVFAMWKGISPWPEEDLKQPIDMWSVVEHCWNPDPAKRMGPRACGKYMRTLAAGSLNSAPDDEQRKLLEVLESTHFATPTIPMLQQGAGKECVQDENHQIPASKTDVVDNLRQLFRSLMKRTPTIPNEVLDLILRHCSRFSLANCCHINRRFYSIAVMHLYEDPFAVDRFDYLGYGGSFHTRLTGLLETLENNNHLAKLVRVFRNRFWSQEYMWRRAITRVLPHLKHLIALDFYARDYPVELRSQILIIVAALRDHSPSVRHIKFDALPNYPRPQGDFEMIRVLSSSLLHLRDIDVTIPCDVDAEPPLTMVQTIAKTCPGLRFIKWKSISYHQQGHAYPLGQAQRVFQFALIDDIWETVQDSGIERASSHLF